MQARCGGFNAHARALEVHRDHRSHHRWLDQAVLLRVVDGVRDSRPSGTPAQCLQHALDGGFCSVGASSCRQCREQDQRQDRCDSALQIAHGSPSMRQFGPCHPRARRYCLTWLQVPCSQPRHTLTGYGRRRRLRGSFISFCTSGHGRVCAASAGGTKAGTFPGHAIRFGVGHLVCARSLERWLGVRTGGGPRAARSPTANWRAVNELTKFELRQAGGLGRRDRCTSCQVFTASPSCSMSTFSFWNCCAMNFA